MVSASSGYQGRGGVEQYHVAARRPFSFQHFSNQRGIMGGITAGNVV